MRRGLKAERDLKNKCGGEAGAVRQPGSENLSQKLKVFLRAEVGCPLAVKYSP